MKTLGSWKLWLSLCATVFVLALFGGAWFFSGMILYPHTHTCKPKHYVYCGTPKDQKLPYQDVTFKTEDGLSLKGWWMPAANGDTSKAIIFVHGRNGTRREGMRYAPALHKAGYQILAFDLRRCGESQGQFSSMGYHEQKDVVAAVDFVQRRGIEQIGVMGFSMGASTSIMVMARDNRIQAGVFEGGFADAATVLVENAERMYGLPRYPIFPLVQLFTNLRAKMDLSDVNPARVIGKIAPRAVYIIHSKVDKQVPPHHGKELFQAARQPKQFWQVDTNQHAFAWQTDRKKAETSVIQFFYKHLQAKKQPETRTRMLPAIERKAPSRPEPVRTR